MSILSCARLFNFLDQNQFLQNTCLVVTSDHGEMLERGISGHNNPVLFEPIIHIPLIVFYPGQNEHQDIHQPTSAVDVLPTLLQLAGAPCARMGRRSSIARIFSEQQGWKIASLYVRRSKIQPETWPPRKATFALVQEQYKLVYYSGYPGYDEVYELYDLREDPEEINNILFIK